MAFAPAREMLHASFAWCGNFALNDNLFYLQWHWSVITDFSLAEVKRKAMLIPPKTRMISFDPSYREVTFHQHFPTKFQSVTVDTHKSHSFFPASMLAQASLYFVGRRKKLVALPF